MRLESGLATSRLSPAPALSRPAPPRPTPAPGYSRRSAGNPLGARPPPRGLYYASRE
jgi:hypothetical protein